MNLRGEDYFHAPSRFTSSCWQMLFGRSFIKEENKKSHCEWNVIIFMLKVE